VTNTIAPAVQRVPPGPWLVAAALAIVYVVWGSTYLGIAVMVVDMPALVAAGSRFVLAGVLLALILALRSGVRRLAVPPAQLPGDGGGAGRRRLGIRGADGGERAAVGHGLPRTDR
jgi:hypothetical protein